MGTPLKIDIVTIFPRMLDGFLGESMLKRAARSGAVEFRLINLREYTTDPHRTTDDRPYGGGPGMVMKPEPLFAAVETIRAPGARVVLMTPQGRRFDQAAARRLAGESHLIFICGHYEGVDERVRGHLVDEELSIGDYVLTNGALAAAVVADAVVRLLPGVLGAEDGAGEESFSEAPVSGIPGGLEYPHYTRPEEFRGWKVPDVLLSGDHETIRQWRREQARTRTRARRPDLLDPETDDDAGAEH